MAELPLTEDATDAVPLHLIAEQDFDAWRAGRSDTEQAWLASTGFRAKGGTTTPLAAPDGGLAAMLAGLAADADLWDLAGLARTLPGGTYVLASAADAEARQRLALAWALGGYAFDRYLETPTPPAARLVWPDGVDRAEVGRIAEYTYTGRDLINTPASDMGPEALAYAGQALAKGHGADCRIIVGDDLLAEGYPAVHAVGRAAAVEPRLIDFTWGDATAPKLTLVGKGVCFDTGGLDLKGAAGMKLMKKDMGGGAHALAVAGMIMDAGLPVRLRVLVPAVENSVAGNAMRPLDILETRLGLSVEVTNTDAEGRLILADALTDAASEKPDAIIDFATLTGARAIALGEEVPALYANDDELAETVLAAARAVEDPLWRMPLWQPYRRKLKSKAADLLNSPESRFGGSITAALFLERFVTPACPWVHIDQTAWISRGRPGRAEGGEMMGARAVFEALRRRYGG